MTVHSRPAVVLAGDIGGTNARLRLARARAGRLDVVAEESLRVADFEGLEDAIDAFVSRTRAGAAAPFALERACFAVAGPIEGARAKLTNATWTIDADAIGRRFGIARVRLVNDFHAAAAGVDEIAPEQTLVLQQGIPVPTAPRVVMGAGTGLGVAYAIPVDGGFRVVPGEGGHVGFAPANDEQIELTRFVQASVGRVTAEHLLSGPGIVRLYAFATSSIDRAGTAIAPDVVHDGAAAVARRARDGEPAARRALELFAAILGAVAGDHALSVLASGGVYIAGGVAAKLAEHLKSGAFLAAFNAKGAHCALMARMPVRVVLDESLGLAGAARLALDDDAS
jgi:glucokinase